MRGWIWAIALGALGCDGSVTDDAAASAGAGGGSSSVATVGATGGSAPVPETLAEGVEQPRDLVLGSDGLYWPSNTDVGSVFRLPLPAADAAAVVSTSESAQHVAVDEANVVWTDWTGGAVLKAPRTGGAAETLASSFPLSDFVALAGGRAFWTTFVGKVHSVPIAGGAVVEEADASVAAAPEGLVTDGASLVVANQDGSIFARPVAGGDWAPIAPADGRLCTSLAIDATHVYWASSNDSLVRRVPTAGGEIETLISGEQVSDLAPDGADLYYVAVNGCIRKVAKTGGAPVDVTREPSDCLDLVVDDAFVYFTSYGSPSDSLPHATRLLRVAK